MEVEDKELTEGEEEVEDKNWGEEDVGDEEYINGEEAEEHTEDEEAEDENCEEENDVDYGDVEKEALGEGGGRWCQGEQECTMSEKMGSTTECVQGEKVIPW